MLQIKEKTTYRLIYHDKTKPIKNGRKNYKFIVNKMFNVTPTDPGDVNEEQVHQTLQKIARKIRVHDPKCNLDLKLGFQSCHKMKNWNMKKFNKQIPRINKSQQKFALNFSG